MGKVLSNLPRNPEPENEEEKQELRQKALIESLEPPGK